MDKSLFILLFTMEEILCRTCLSAPKETEFVDMVNEMFESESVLEVVTKFASIKVSTFMRFT